MLDLVGLTDLATEGERLSGGQRRRVGLAQALLGEPRVLVLDEPTTGLDPAQRANLRRTLSFGHRSTVLLSTHQTEDVAALCERVVVLPRARCASTAPSSTWSPPPRAGSGSPTSPVTTRPSPGAPAPAATASSAGPPPGAEPAEPTLEDAYLLMLGPDAPVRAPPDRRSPHPQTPQPCLEAS